MYCGLVDILNKKYWWYAKDYVSHYYVLLMFRLCRATSKVARGAPFRPLKSVAVDMFPHTDKLEMIMLFERLPDSSSDNKTEASEEKEVAEADGKEKEAAEGEGEGEGESKDEKAAEEIKNDNSGGGEGNQNKETVEKASDDMITEPTSSS